MEVLIGEREVRNIPAFAIGHFRSNETDLTKDVEGLLGSSASAWLANLDSMRWRIVYRRYRRPTNKQSAIHETVLILDDLASALEFKSRFSDVIRTLRLKYWESRLSDRSTILKEAISRGDYDISKLKPHRRHHAAKAYLSEVKSIARIERTIRRLTKP